MNDIFIIKTFEEEKDKNGIYFEERSQGNIDGYFTTRENAAQYIKKRVDEFTNDFHHNIINNKIYETGNAEITYAFGYKRIYYTITKLSLIK